MSYKGSVDFPRPIIRPIPENVQGLSCFYREVGPDWLFCEHPPRGFEKNATEQGEWKPFSTPMQLIGERAHEYAYTTTIQVPEQWNGYRIILRMEGVCGHSRIFLNGQEAGKRIDGGFVDWDCDVTYLIQPGQENRLTLGVTDANHELSDFQLGGIIRGMKLLALPEVHITRLHADTVFDALYHNVWLTVYSEVSEDADNREILLELESPAGEIVLSDTHPASMTKKSYPVTAPEKWDSEHPVLYTLRAGLLQGGRVQETISKKIGFRQVELRGNQIFVNNQEVKLRGINRHDIHAVTGRAITYELVEEDVRLFHEANINFIRTSHYPPRADFLDLCDRYGIYVEEEAAISFVGQINPRTESDPAFSDRYLSQAAQMVERDRSHPCIIMWSLANESIWGDNFDLENRYIHETDPGRPTIFSYPITATVQEKCADIWSLHYSDWNNDINGLLDGWSDSRNWVYDKPVLHDESTHIVCYNVADQRRDPSVRDYWGITIKKFWNRIWNTQGALGCAIWAGIDASAPFDETNGETHLGALSNNHFLWGILDVWRRRKPEFWHVRKGFSPICVKSATNRNGISCFEIENRFNHTNLSEIKVTWKTAEKSGELQCPAGMPHETVRLEIPSGEEVYLTFSNARGFVLDDYLLAQRKKTTVSAEVGAISVVENGRFLLCTGEDFRVVFSKETGLVCEGKAGDESLLCGGPYLHLSGSGVYLNEWECSGFSWESGEDQANIHICGNYGPLKVHFDIGIRGGGTMTTNCVIEDMAYPNPRGHVIRGDQVDCGGYDEVGIYYLVSSHLDRLSWEKKGLWSTYPDWHIGRKSGTAIKSFGNAQVDVKKKPDRDWKDDEREPFLFGIQDIGLRGTVDFRSMKTHIYYAQLYAQDKQGRVSVQSDGSISLRMEPLYNVENIVSDRDEGILYTGNWYQKNGQRGSDGNTETWSSDKRDSIEYTFSGTGIAVCCIRDTLCGGMRVFIDGELSGENIPTVTDQLFSSAARGQERITNNVAFSAEGLESREHTIRIEVEGERNRRPLFFTQGSYIMFDRFIVLNGQEQGMSKLLLIDKYNFPELSWGNYMFPPVLIHNGYEIKTTFKLET